MKIAVSRLPLLYIGCHVLIRIILYILQLSISISSCIFPFQVVSSDSSSRFPFSPSFLSFTRFNQDPNWSETGDRYLLKLFRDHLFHQVTAEGAPWLDLAHIVQSLNKVCGAVQHVLLNLGYPNQMTQNIRFCHFIELKWLPRAN